MSAFDLLIKGGKVVFYNDVYYADIAVKDEKIAAIASPGEITEAREEIDATGLVVMTGLIDPHVHMRDPGSTDREDFASGTKAAAAGGITTVIDHPNTVPPVNSVENLNAKRDTLAPKSHVDFSLFGAAGSENLAEIGKLAQAGVVAFKTFLHGAPPGREAEFEGLCTTDDGELYKVLSETGKTGLLSCIHAENDAIIEKLIAEMREKGDVLGDAHERSRPVETEVEAVARVAILGKAVGTRINIVHLSSGTAARFIAMLKEHGYPLVVETCPQYLFATVEKLNELGPLAKINPPLRSKEEQNLLWECVNNGTIDMIGSDHATHRPSDKEKGHEDIFAAGAGAPSIETTLLLFLNAVNEGNLTLERLTQLVSQKTAVEYGLYPQKGVIQVGSDADFVLVDMEASYRIDPAQMYTKQRMQARLFEGYEGKGRPVMTIVRGNVIMKDGRIMAEPGCGRFVPRLK